MNGLRRMGNYIQYLVITYDGKELEKNIYITKSLYYTTKLIHYYKSLIFQLKDAELMDRKAGREQELPCHSENLPRGEDCYGLGSFKRSSEC